MSPSNQNTTSTNWRGCGTALVTPFTSDGNLDEPSMARLVQRQIEGGVHFLVPCGTTGETPTLSHEEKLRVVDLVIETSDGRVPILAGAGSYDTKSSIVLAKEMEQLGVTGLLSVTPFYNKPSSEGLFQHFRALAESTQLPIIVYNVPSRTGCNLDTPTLLRLADIPNIVGVKEASGNLGQVSEICHSAPKHFSVLSGDDVFTLPLISLGGAGVISVVSNETPSEMSQLVTAALEGDFETARRHHNFLFPLMQINFIESNPIPVKAAMAQMNLLREVYRLPLVPPCPEAREKITQVLQQLGLLANSLEQTEE